MIMKLLAKFITNKRILNWINSNRFRGAVIVGLTWLLDSLFPGMFGDSVVGQMVTEIIIFLGGMVTLVGLKEAQDRRYSEKEKSWKEPA